MNFENMSKEELIEYINNLNEEQSGKYGLVWDAEKVPEQVVVDCNKLIPVLKEEENKKIDNGGEDNILIEGDNFHSLSVLNYTHKESIDVIYIDPPYNSNFAIKAVEIIINQKLADENSTIIIETDNEKKILEELKKTEVEIIDKRKYGRATLIFIKIRKG